MHPCIPQRTALFSITEQGESMSSRPSPVNSWPLPSKKISLPRRSCESSGITGKYIDFSKTKLFHQRDNIDVSKKNGNEKI